MGVLHFLSGVSRRHAKAIADQREMIRSVKRGAAERIASAHKRRLWATANLSSLRPDKPVPDA